MDYGGYSYEYGYPFTGERLNKVKAFLKENRLDYDDGILFTVNLFDHENEIIATGSMADNILKCIAISDRYQGEGLCASVLTHLLTHAAKEGLTHLFLFTRPANKSIFSGLGFYPIVETPDVLMMENKKNGLQSFVDSLYRPEINSDIGAIVANCNPFTNGHLYLIETAARACKWLHLFILSEDKSDFSTEVRYRLVCEGVSHLKNVTVHGTSHYLISTATFPTYFIKNKAKINEINCTLDLTLFKDYFAKNLNITKRFVGTEPFCPVTAKYNEQMKAFFDGTGIEVVEIPRLLAEGEGISASRVRRLMAQGDYASIQLLVPPATYDYILSSEGVMLAEKLKNEAIQSPHSAIAPKGGEHG